MTKKKEHNISKYVNQGSSTDIEINTDSKSQIIVKNEENCQPFLGAIEEAPQYIIDNIYILTGYRINFLKLRHIFKSLFMIHNETINIWSHLIGCLTAIGLMIDLYFYDPVPGHQIEKWPIVVFLLSGMACMFFSSFYHLFFVLDPKVANILLRLDYAGICFLIVGSSYPLTYYGFYCKPHLLTFYLVLNSVAGVIVFICHMMDFIYTPKYFQLKSAIMGMLGLFIAIPLFHRLVYEALQDDKDQKYNTLQTMPYYMTMAFVDYAGLFIYAKRCPEKQYPGKFDICGHSHQLMHVSNIIGMIFTYFACLIHYQDRIEHSCH